MLFFIISENPVRNHKRRKIEIDENLFEKIGRQDYDALGELYELTERAVYSYVFSILKNADDTKDVVQETYMKICAAAHLYQARGKPLAWIFTIARNLSMSFLRKKRNMVSSEEMHIDDDVNYSYITDPTDKMVLHGALYILNENERQVILLHLVSGMKHQEIARSIGIPISTVLSRYHRGLKKLKKYLTEQEGF